MLQWEKKKKEKITKKEKAFEVKKTMKRNLDPKGSVFHEVTRLKLSANMDSNQKPLQSQCKPSPTYPKQCQPIPIRLTTSLLSQTSQYLQTVRKERKEKLQENPLNNKKLNFLTPSLRLSVNRKNMRKVPSLDNN